MCWSAPIPLTLKKIIIFSHFFLCILHTSLLDLNFHCFLYEKKHWQKW